MSNDTHLAGLRAELHDLEQRLASTHIVAAPRYRDYLRRFKGPGKPMPQDAWESKVLGKPKSEDKPEAPKKDEPKKPEAPKKDEKGKDEKGKDEKGKDEKAPKKTYKKNYNKTVSEVMDKHSLTDDDADELKAHKKKLFNPGAKEKMTDAERMRKFLSMAKPETKERMKGMTPADFMKILGAIMDEEGEGGGKQAGLTELRAQLHDLDQRQAQRRQAEYLGQAEQFAAALRKEWRNAKYDPKTGSGTAELGRFAITFHESGSDGGVVVNFMRVPRMKADAKTLLAVLDDLATLWNRVD